MLDCIKSKLFHKQDMSHLWTNAPSALFFENLGKGTGALGVGKFTSQNFWFGENEME